MKFYSLRIKSYLNLCELYYILLIQLAIIMRSKYQIKITYNCEESILNAKRAKISQFL